MSTIIIAVHPRDPDRLFAKTVLARRHGLDVSAAELARASGIPCRTLQVIEAGGSSTYSERHDIAVAFRWLSSTRLGRSVTV